MAKFLIYTVCIISVLSRNTKVQTMKLPTGCDDAEAGKAGHFACGSEISSQFVASDGSLITDSKGSTFSSDGIKRTFHKLQKEADEFVSNTNRQDYGQASGAFFSSGSFSEHQAGGSGQLYQHFPSIPQSSKLTTVHKEQVEKKIYTSKGSSSYGNSNGEEVSEIGDGSGVNLVYTPPVVTYQSVVPEVENFGSTDSDTEKHYALQHSSKTVNATHSSIPELHVPVAVASGSQSSYQTYESDHQQRVTGSKQSNFVPNIKPNTFTIGVIDFGNKFTNEPSIESITKIGNGLPFKQKPPTKENHYKPESNVQENYNFQSESLVKSSNPIRFPDEDENHLKTEEVESKQVNHDYSKNQNEYSHTLVGSTVNSNSGLPTSRLVIKAKAPAIDTSQTTREKMITSQSHTVSSNGQHLPLDASLVNVADSSYTSQVGTNRLPSPTSLDTSKTKTGTSSQTYYIHSPVLLHGLPQTVPLENQSENGANEYYYSSSSYGGTSGSSSIPVLVRGVPQNLSISNQKLTSSSDGTQFYTSNSQPIYNQRTSSSSSSSHFSSKGVAPLLSNSNNFVGQGDTNILNTGSTSFEKSRNQHAHSNTADCSVCTGNRFTSSGQPVKSSYGFSTSFSSSSSNVNGKKTENRAASVLVNDNGKIDSYIVES